MEDVTHPSYNVITHYKVQLDFVQVHLWDVSTTTKLQQLSMVSTPALDLLPFGSANEQLAVLTESQLFTYKWQ